MAKANRYVQYFISHPEENGIRQIADYFNVSFATVSQAIDKYYSDKMDAKNNPKRVPSKHGTKDSGITQS